MEPCGRKKILILRKKDAGAFLERPDMRPYMVSHIPPECKLAGLSGMGNSTGLNYKYRLRRLTESQFRKHGFLYPVSYELGEKFRNLGLWE